MNEVTERRRADCPRIPIDVPIEITDGEYSDPVEADAVSLGEGGLSMRAAFLPELGSHLTCRFSSPEGGRYIEAMGEVVWAQDRGPHMGEFGVRFVRVDGESRDAIAEMVAAWGDLMTDHDVTPPKGGVPDDESPAQDARGSKGVSTLYIEGVASPIVTNLIHDGEETSIMEQALPFLRIGRGVTVEGEDRHGILSTVALRVDGDMPRLLLGVEWDSPPSVQIACTKEDTLNDFEAPTFQESEDLVAAVVGIMDEEVPDVDEFGILIGEAQFAQSATAGATVTDDFASELESMRPSLSQRVSAILSSLRERGTALRPKISKLFGKIGPALVLLWKQITKRAPRLWGHIALWVRKLTEPSRRGIHTVVNAVRIRMGMQVLSRRRGGGRRRRTSLPPRREVSNPSTSRRRQGAAKLPRRGGQAGRWGMFALLLIGVGLGVYALTPAESAEATDTSPLLDEGTAAPLERATPYRVAAPVVPEPVPEAAEPEELNLEPEAVVAPRMPTALPEATRQAGPLGAVTAEPTIETPSDEPPVVADGRTFGAASVDNGRVFRLRMSLPIQGVTGERIANGFRVTIPESLALDRAGPIAASHPDVDRAMILNRGDHAELTIRFVEGRTPAYRVSARGATLELTIGR